MPDPIQVSDPGKLTYVTIVKVVEDGRVHYVPESCANSVLHIKRALAFKEGQQIRIKWPNGSITRQAIAPIEYLEEVDRPSGKTEVVKSNLLGFWRGVGAVDIRGWSPPKPVVWVELDGVALEMREIELRAFEHQCGAVALPAAVAAPVPAQPQGDSAAILTLLEKLAGRLDALETTEGD